MIESLVDPDEQRKEMEYRLSNPAPESPPHVPRVWPELSAVVVQKMSFAPTERSVNRGYSGHRRNQFLHALMLVDMPSIGRKGRKKGEFVCSQANRSRGFDVFGYPEMDVTCPNCDRLIKRHSINLIRDKSLAGYGY
jgi:hypothetical protein